MTVWGLAGQRIDLMAGVGEETAAAAGRDARLQRVGPALLDRPGIEAEFEPDWHLTGRYDPAHAPAILGLADPWYAERMR
jgi:hypothetical protein